MIDLNGELAGKYLAESRYHLASMETDLLALEESGVRIDEERVNRIFRAIHSIKTGAGILELVKIGELADHTENVVMLFRSGTPDLTPERVRCCCVPLSACEIWFRTLAPATRPTSRNSWQL